MRNQTRGNIWEDNVILVGENIYKPNRKLIELCVCVSKPGGHANTKQMQRQTHRQDIILIMTIAGRFRFDKVHQKIFKTNVQKL